MTCSLTLFVREWYAAHFWSKIVCMGLLGEFWSIFKVSRVYSIFRSLYHPWRPFYGTEVRIIGIFGIVLSARIVGGIARVHQSVRSQSHVSPLGGWILPWPPMGVQDLIGVWFENSFSVRVV
ncbi:hypothetical protein NPIL_104331 [Nephila pilipes]|uniref:Uncharacterized protein n=1 Tax=Nephila pilipes TaxID=299642 RepID=A0A8X6NKJ9_NEPPI|nr:hypothetical protein NPIL_104331 [Nephila pilipes]